MDKKVFVLNDQKKLEISTAEAFFSSERKNSEIYWADVQAPDPKALSEFLAPLRLHPLILEGCLEPTANSRIESFEGALFVQLPTRTRWDDSYHFTLSLICLPGSLITIHATEMPALNSIESDFTGAMFFHSCRTVAVVYQIIDRLVDQGMVFAAEARRKIDDAEEALETQVMDYSSVEQMRELKWHAAHLEMICEDQRTCVKGLQTIESEAFNIQDYREYFRDILTNLEYVLRSFGRQQSRLSELRQHYMIAQQEKVNNRLRILTIVSAIFMPLTLMTGIYGMNFRYMPELYWRYSYPVVLGIMLLIFAVMMWTFFRKGWFK